MDNSTSVSDSEYPLFRCILVLLLIPALIFTLAACESPATPTIYSSSIPTTPIASQTPDTSWYDVFFSDPTDPNAERLRGGPDRALANAIHQARMSVDVAAYDLNLWSIRDALLDAHHRGLTVRMVTDSDNLDGPEIQDLRLAGIQVLGDRREGLMHNKFLVIDRQDVWTGSMNLTINSAYRNNDNLVHIRAPRLAEDYTVEFEEMFINDQFGPGSPANTPYPKLKVGGTNLEVYFSPDDGVQEQIIRLIQDAQESIVFLAYSLTSDEIAGALIERAQAGVNVAGVMETAQVQSNRGGEFDKLRQAGLGVRLDSNPDNLHHKVIIIDSQTVITGSYNFSKNAEFYNDENVLVIHDPQVAMLFLEEFARLFQTAIP
jgi:phosphatidylserine/phosphatidylglycerophosphate/cardiolipin synthase-like enzyme